MIRAFSLAALLSTSFAIAAASDAEPKHVGNEWQLSIDATGNVVELRDLGKLAEPIKDALERAIRGWKFEPGKLDGKPVATETALTLEVSFLPVADGYSLRIDDARVGGTTDAASLKRNPPRPPVDAFQRMRGSVAMVVIKLDYDSDGHVVAVDTLPTESLNAPSSMQRATVAAAKHWRIKPERVGGKGVASSVTIPICYSVGYGLREPKFSCSWTPPGSKTSVGDGVAFAARPATKILTDVIGRTL